MSEERLKRIEILLETAAKMSVNHEQNTQTHDIQILIFESEYQELKSKTEQSSQELNQRMTELTLQNAILSDRMVSLTDMFGETMQVIKAMQSDIKG